MADEQDLPGERPEATPTPPVKKTPAKAAKKAPAKKAPAKKAPAKKAPAKKAPAAQAVPPAPTSNGSAPAPSASEPPATTRIAPPADRAQQLVPAAAANRARSPLSLTVAIAIGVLAILVLRRVRRGGDD